MELAHYLGIMASMKRRHNSSSWEEKAFAEDLGGIVWPARCYSCTFCHREFRSAQALGGHMNVHRRDRARLKQSSLPNPNPSPSLFRVSAAQLQEEEHQEKKVFLLSSSISSSVITQKDRSRLLLDDGIMGLKRVKVMNTKNVSSMMMFPANKCSGQEDVVVEELDLELRLGNGAAAKLN